MPPLQLDGIATAEVVPFSSRLQDIDHLRELFTVEVTQLSRGSSCGLMKGAIGPRAAVSRFDLEPDAIVGMELPVDTLTFSVPLMVGDPWRINGMQGVESCLLLHGGASEVVGRARRRRLLGGVLGLAPFLDDFAALLGAERDGLAAPRGLFRLSPLEKQALVEALSRFIAQGHAPANAPAGAAAAGDDRRIIHLVAELAARRSTAATPARPCGLPRIAIFRAAEAEADRTVDVPPMLADLCRAAGVSAPTLTAVFRDVVGLTPMKYFTLRRLARARKTLEHGAPRPSPVKRAALENGFRDLSKFSRLYRKVYGEPPSQTLRT